ncbi:hypothetical protein [Rhodopseudomonas palustris]|uniref:hypothetical protein n=1 Tax=Rhodopseudomonas palustris TaxID=1076 RepID=UPI0002E23DBD|nr:hypothetical protein [Rhodopseudomonas palustris]
MTLAPIAAAMAPLTPSLRTVDRSAKPVTGHRGRKQAPGIQLHAALEGQGGETC